MYIPKHLKFKRNKKGRALVAAKKIRKGTVVLPLKGSVFRTCREATPEAVQIDEDKFIDSFHLYTEDFINHSCDPNLKIDFENMNFIALRNIKKDEELNYNYLTTEYDLVRDKLDFNCKCGSKNCLKKIRGFKFLTKKQKLKLKSLLSPFLRKKLEKE